MLRYSQLIPDVAQRQEHLRITIEDFKDSIEAHKDLQSLTSREEFFVFACAVYKLGLTHQEMSAPDSIHRAQHLGKIAMLLYEHYCSFTGMILLDDNIAKLIAHCLNFLQLSQFCDEGTDGLTEISDDNRAGVASCDTKEELGDKGTGSSSLQMSSTDYPMSNTDLPVSSTDYPVSNTDYPVNGLQASVNTVNEEFIFASHEAVLKVRSEGQSITEKLKETREQMTTEGLSAVMGSIPVYSRELQPEKNAASNSGLTVDRCCETKDSRSNVTMETVDRSVVTQELEQETVPLPCDRFLPPEVATVQTQLQGLNLDSSKRVQGNDTINFHTTRGGSRGMT